MKRQRTSARLQRFERELQRIISAMKRRELHAVANELKTLDPNEVSFVLFELRNAITHLVRVELVRRDRRRRQQVLPL